MAKKKTPEAHPQAEEEIIETIKGFNKDWTCRGFQYQIGQTYHHDGPVQACDSGFHAVEGNPLRVFQYYQPAKSNYAITKQWGKLDRQDDGKVASASITIHAEIGIGDLITRAVKFLIKRAKSAGGRYVDGDNSLAYANGIGSSSASNGYGSSSASNGIGSSSASNGDRSSSASNGYGSSSASNGIGSSSASNGDRSSSASNGYGSSSASNGIGSSSASNGDRSSSASNGDRSSSASNGYGSSSASNGIGSSSASNGDRSSSASNGDRSSSASNGDRSSSASNGTGSSSASNGDRSSSASNGYGSSSASNGKAAVAMSAGEEGRVKGDDGNALFLVYRDPKTSEIIHAWAGIVGRDDIKAGTWYQLNADGKPIEFEL